MHALVVKRLIRRLHRLVMLLGSLQHALSDRFEAVGRRGALGDVLAEGEGGDAHFDCFDGCGFGRV